KLYRHEHTDRDSPLPSSENPHSERSRATSCRLRSFDTGRESRVPQRRAHSCPHAIALPLPTDHLQRSTKRIVDGAIRAKVHIRRQQRNRDVNYTSRTAPPLSVPIRSHDSLRDQV